VQLGAMKDIHWAVGLVGNFPTYALRNLIAVQTWESMERDLPDIADQMAGGEFSSLLGWMQNHVHAHGSKFKTQELMKKIAGSKIDPAYYLRYLRKKYAQVYGL
jgi:carboxypeptidase Taq